MGVFDVTWESIIGNREAKQRLYEIIIMPQHHQALFESFGKRRERGIVLYGPPGCGKTLCAKAVATSLAQSSGGEMHEDGFIAINGAEIMCMWQGQSANNLRVIFSRAKMHYKSTGVPSVIFWDECDSVLANRDYRGGDRYTVVAAFLTELDGLKDDSGAIVLLATNLPDVIDQAVTRDGRCSYKVRVGRPSRKDTQEMFRFYLDKTLIDAEASSADIAQRATEAIFTSAMYLVDFNEGEPEEFTLGDMVSGALVCGAVERAKLSAIHRAIANSGQADGVRGGDVLDAVRVMYEENMGFNNRSAINEFSELRGFTVAGVRRIGRGRK